MFQYHILYFGIFEYGLLYKKLFQDIFINDVFITNKLQVFFELLVILVFMSTPSLKNIYFMIKTEYKVHY